MRTASGLSTLARLGLAASLLWALGSAYALTQANRRAYFDAHSKDCLALQKTPPPGFTLWACGEENRALWHEARVHAWDGVPLRALGPIALAWLCTYGIARLIRRTRN
jgi:hypothetical protein